MRLNPALRKTPVLSLSMNKAVLSDDPSGIAAAVDAARSADVVVAVLGDMAGHFQNGTVGEGSDVTSLALPGLQ